MEIRAGWNTLRFLMTETGVPKSIERPRPNVSLVPKGTEATFTFSKKIGFYDQKRKRESNFKSTKEKSKPNCMQRLVIILSNVRF